MQLEILSVAIILDCRYLLEQGYTTNGIYTINPDDAGPFDAYCDMSEDGGGWTVFQHRVDNTTDFYRDYANYTMGFGDLDDNMWAGLDHLYSMTSSYDVELHVYMDTFENEQFYAQYSNFAVGNASSGYRLYVNGYSGTAGDSFSGKSILNFKKCVLKWLA